MLTYVHAMRQATALRALTCSCNQRSKGTSAVELIKAWSIYIQRAATEVAATTFEPGPDSIVDSIRGLQAASAAIRTSQPALRRTAGQLDRRRCL